MRLSVRDVMDFVRIGLGSYWQWMRGSLLRFSLGYATPLAAIILAVHAVNGDNGIPAGALRARNLEPHRIGRCRRQQYLLGAVIHLHRYADEAVARLARVGTDGRYGQLLELEPPHALPCGYEGGEAPAESPFTHG